MVTDSLLAIARGQVSQVESDEGSAKVHLELCCCNVATIRCYRKIMSDVLVRQESAPSRNLWDENFSSLFPTVKVVIPTNHIPGAAKRRILRSYSIYVW